MHTRSIWKPLYSISNSTPFSRETNVGPIDSPDMWAYALPKFTHSATLRRQNSHCCFNQSTQSVTIAVNISTPNNSPQKTRGYFLLALLLGTGVILFEMTKLFLVPVVLAATFAGLFYPLYTKLVHWTRGLEGLSALTSCVILLLGLLVPAYIVTDLVVQESLGIYKSAGRWTANLLNSKDSLNLSEKLNQFELLQSLELNHLDWQQPLQDAIKTTAGWATSFINKTSRSTLQLFANFFIMLFTMFYFFRDGPLLLQRLHQLSPLNPRYERGLIERFVSVLSLIHIWRCRRSTLCRSRWSPYH